MNPIVVKLEEQFLPQFRDLVDDLSKEYSGLKFSVFSHDVGSAAEYQGYSIGVECIFPDAKSEDPDNVALSVDLAYLKTMPRISAGVGWGHPSGYSEAVALSGGSSSEWDEVSEETIKLLYSDLPRLTRAFKNAVERGRPPE